VLKREVYKSAGDMRKYLLHYCDKQTENRLIITICNKQKIAEKNKIVKVKKETFVRDPFVLKSFVNG